MCRVQFNIPSLSVKLYLLLFFIYISFPLAPDVIYVKIVFAFVMHTEGTICVLCWQTVA